MWVDEDKLPEGWQEDLTIRQITYTDDMERHECFTQSDRVGVPIQWAIDNGIEFPIIRYLQYQWPNASISYRQGQEESVKNLVHHFARNYTGRLEAPCGAGKTLMALDIASKLSTNVLVIVPKTDLAKQWRGTVVGNDDRFGFWPSFFP